MGVGYVITKDEVYGNLGNLNPCSLKKYSFSNALTGVRGTTTPLQKGGHQSTDEGL